MPSDTTALNVLSSSIADNDIPLLIARLYPLLPRPLPLYRRLQFHLHHPNPPHAHAFVAVSVRPESSIHTIPEWLQQCDPATQAMNSTSDNNSNDPEPWIAAHIDLSFSGQTQIWLFGSWESYPTDMSDFNPSGATITNSHDPISAHFSSALKKTIPSPDPNPTHNLLFRTLLTHLYTKLIPSLPTTPPEYWLELQRGGKILSTPYSPYNVLFGTLHESLWPLFPISTISRSDHWYGKYLIPVPSSADQASTLLPTGMDFGQLRTEHLHTVVSRTTIPRTVATLAQYQNLGLFLLSSSDSPPPPPSSSSSSHSTPSVELVEQKPEHKQPELVGWGFLGKDASLSSLHTESHFRGQGLAVALARELLSTRQKLAFPPHHDKISEPVESSAEHQPPPVQEWAHADVSASNIGSMRVMQKLGGRVAWRVAWVEIDVEKYLL